MCDITYPKFPCRICVKNVSDKDKAVQCELCEFWVHIKCNNLNYLDHSYLQNSNESWYSRKCCSKIILFNSLCSNKNFLSCCTNTDNNNTHWIDLENDHNSSLSLKPSNLELLVKQFNNASPEDSNDPEKVCSSKYYNNEEMLNIKIPHKNKLVSQLPEHECMFS